ncbi:MAG: ribosome maturation factor RimP [Wenzhouxiangellaceae bacterium]|nr:ribosome maturation factor RimP [Wenzhouxiangellaceae bacterium]
MSVQHELKRIVQPVVEQLGLEFVGVEYLSNPKNRCVRVYIDREPDGITVDDCAAVSHEISARLDIEDPVSGQYNLEVSSPGVERPLFEPAHFRRFVGERARLDLVTPIEDRRRISGVISDADDERVVMAVDDRDIEVPYGSIRRAHLKPDLAQLFSNK